MKNKSLPDRQQLRKELEKVARVGLGRTLPGRQSEETVRGLSEISRALAHDPAEDWPLRIGRIVLEEVEAFGPAQDRPAIAYVLAIDLERPLEEFSKKRAGPLESAGDKLGRYAQAAELYGVGEREFAETRRVELLERLAGRLLERLETKESQAPEDEVAESRLAEVVAEAAIAEQDQSSSQSPMWLVGAVGSLLIIVGLIWLLAVATGRIG